MRWIGKGFQWWNILFPFRLNSETRMFWHHPQSHQSPPPHHHVYINFSCSASNLIAWSQKAKTHTSGASFWKARWAVDEGEFGMANGICHVEHLKISEFENIFRTAQLVWISHHSRKRHPHWHSRVSWRSTTTCLFNSWCSGLSLKTADVSVLRYKRSNLSKEFLSQLLPVKSFCNCCIGLQTCVQRLRIFVSTIMSCPPLFTHWSCLVQSAPDWYRVRFPAISIMSLYRTLRSPTRLLNWLMVSEWKVFLGFSHIVTGKWYDWKPQTEVCVVEIKFRVTKFMGVLLRTYMQLHVHAYAHTQRARIHFHK